MINSSKVMRLIDEVRLTQLRTAVTRIRDVTGATKAFLPNDLPGIENQDHILHESYAIVGNFFHSVDAILLLPYTKELYVQKAPTLHLLGVQLTQVPSVQIKNLPEAAKALYDAVPMKGQYSQLRRLTTQDPTDDIGVVLAYRNNLEAFLLKTTFEQGK